MVGGFNADLAETEVNARDEDISESVVTELLEYMPLHFLLCHIPWVRDIQTWGMIRQGREVWSRTDYILVTDCHLFCNLSVWYPRHNIYHYIILG